MGRGVGVGVGKKKRSLNSPRKALALIATALSLGAKPSAAVRVAVGRRDSLQRWNSKPLVPPPEEVTSSEPEGSRERTWMGAVMPRPADMSTRRASGSSASAEVRALEGY